MNEELNKAIIKTLAFFDVFDHSLTREELLRLLWRKRSLDCLDFWNLKYSDLCYELDNMENSGKIGKKYGYYYIEASNLVEKRRQRTLVAEKKMKIAVRGIKKIRWVPFVNAVFVCNMINLGICTEESDIDVFIITKKGRIWLARFLVTFVLSFFGLRRNKKEIKDRICLSFYVTDDNLDLSKVSIESPDIYLMYWIYNLIPVYDPCSMYDEFMDKNKWVDEYILNGSQEHIVHQRWKVEDNAITVLCKKIIKFFLTGRLGNRIEQYIREMQLNKMKKNKHSVQGEPDTRVVVTDSMLKFHENDRRLHFKNCWKNKCQKYGIV